MSKQKVERAPASIAELQYRLVRGISQSMVEKLLYETQPWEMKDGAMVRKELPRGSVTAAKRALKALQEQLKAEMAGEVE